MTTTLENIPFEKYSGTAVAAGGTMVLDLTPYVNKVTRFHAWVEFGHVTAAAIDAGASLHAQAAFRSTGPAAALIPALVGSANPQNSNSAGLLAAEVQAADNVFRAGGAAGGAPPTAVFTAPGAVARLTITNPGTVDAVVTVHIQRLMGASS